MCVCVKTFSEICKYKALKDAREMEFFCIALRLFIFAFVVILLFVLFDRSLACSDPHPPNLGGGSRRQELSKLAAKVRK